MSVYELQKFTAISKYARYLEEHRRREVWPETVARYRDMLLEKYPHRKDRITDVCRHIESFDVMPSMRGLQFGGPPILVKNARLYNCTGAYCDRLRFFQEAFWLLLCGCGVGFSVQERHVRHLPRFSRKRLSRAELPWKKFVVPDTIEGWADCAAVLLSSYHEVPVRGFEEYHDCEVHFDFTHIRPKGAPLSFGIGTAPGPAPLRAAMRLCRNLLNRAIDEKLTRLDSIHAYDFMMNLADAVVSGGVRRSATIVLFDAWDEKMTNAKVGNWKAHHPQRGRSNNSAVLVRGQTSWETYEKFFSAKRQWGEPGDYWTDHADHIPNPCVEIGFFCKLEIDRHSDSGRRLLRNYEGPVYSVDDSGNLAGRSDSEVALSGWQMCNLTSINGRQVVDKEDFFIKAEMAADLGTWQAGFTDFLYLGEVSEHIVRREALLGVSICGMMHRPDVLLNPDTLAEGASRVVRQNEREAAQIGINAAARSTCVKPDGNLGSLLGSFSGAHPGKFHRGFRIVQVNKNEPPYQYFRMKNEEATEPSVWSKNGTDDIIRFCVEYDGLMEDDMSATDFLAHIRMVQKAWVGGGKVAERCVRPFLSNNVSNTVRVREHEWDAVARYVFDNQNDFAGVSVIDAFGDRDYAQAPFTAVFSPEESAARYGVAPTTCPMVEQLLSTVHCFRDLWDAADCALGQWPDDQPSSEQTKWLACLSEFAEKWFGGDRRMATYLLKDIHNWRLYQRLRQSYQPVDYSLMTEETNTVNLQQEIACAGGACEA